METAIHEALGIVASRGVWATVWPSHIVTRADGTAAVGNLPNGFDELLVLAMASGKTGNEAVACALAEQNRRLEAKTAATATARLAESVLALAKSVKPLEVRVLIERMLPSIPPAAQEEVRKLLRG